MNPGKRYERILSMRNQRFSLVEIGRIFSITGCRVSQILKHPIKDVFAELRLKNQYRGEARKLIRKMNPQISREKWCVLCVHHLDKNPLNNDISNLKIMDRTEHTRLHLKTRKNDKEKPLG